MPLSRLCVSLLLIVGTCASAADPSPNAQKQDSQTALRKYVEKISDNSFIAAIPKSAISASDNSLSALTETEKQRVLDALTAHVAEAVPYSVRTVYNAGEGTGEPYSIPPPRAAIHVYKGKPSFEKTRESDVLILNDEYVMVAGIMIKNRELVLALMKIIDEKK